MRMLGLGLLAVVLAGAAVALSYLGAEGIAQKVQNLVRDPDLTFETAEPRNVPATGKTEGATAVTLRAEPRQAMILSGVPSYQGARFVLPFDARPVGGVLHVDLTSQALDTTEAALRVTIDNARRAELLLEPGVEARSFDIPLTEAELARGVLPVSFSLQGRGSNAPCTGPGIGAVVEIKPSTRLDLVLDGPVTTPRDQLIAWGGAVQAAWPDAGTADADGATRLALAADLIREDYAVSFMNGGTPGTFDLEQMRATIDPAMLQPLSLLTRQEEHYDFPVEMMEMSGNDGVKRFHRSTTWRSRFEAGSLPDGQVPGALDLSLKLGPLPAETTWTVDVTMNGRLAMAESVPAGTTDYDRKVILPATAADRSSSVEVTLSSDYDIEGVCNEGPELLAEMTPETMLYGRPAIEAGPLAELRREIAANDMLQVSMGTELTAPEAAGAARLVAALGGDAVTLSPVATDAADDAQPQAIVLAGGAVNDARALQDDTLDQWVVWADPDTGSAEALRLGTALDRFDGVIWPVSVLVELPHRDLALGENPAADAPSGTAAGTTQTETADMGADASENSPVVMQTGPALELLPVDHSPELASTGSEQQ